MLRPRHSGVDGARWCVDRADAVSSLLFIRHCSVSIRHGSGSEDWDKFSHVTCPFGTGTAAERSTPGRKVGAALGYTNDISSQVSSHRTSISAFSVQAAAAGGPPSAL